MHGCVVYDVSTCLFALFYFRLLSQTENFFYGFQITLCLCYEINSSLRFFPIRRSTVETILKNLKKYANKNNMRSRIMNLKHVFVEISRKRRTALNSVELLI